MSQNNESLIEKIKLIFRKLKESVSNAVLFSIYGNSVLAKLDDLEDRMIEAAENGEITQKSIEELSETVGSISGILKNLTKEDISQVREEVNKFVEECKDSLAKEGKLVDVNEESLYSLVKNSFSDYSSMSKEDFEKHFEKDIQIYDIHKFGNQSSDGSTYALLKLDNNYFKLGLTPTIEDNKKFLFSVHNVDKKEVTDLISSYNEVEPTYGENKLECLERKFFTARGYYTPRTYKESMAYKDLKEKHPDIARNAELLFDSENKVKISSDGRVETYYDSEKNNFYVRDRETKDMICFSSTQNKLSMRFYTDVDDIEKDKDDSSKRINSDKNYWTCNPRGGFTQYKLSFKDFDKSELFYRPEVMDFLSTKSISVDIFKDSLAGSSKGRREAEENQTKCGWYNVYNSALKKVDILKGYLNQAQLRYGTKYKVTSEIKKVKGENSSVVYVNAENTKNGCAMAFSFSKAGEPLTVNFRDGKKEKFKFMLDCTNGIRGKNDVELLQNNAEFRKMTAVFENAYNMYVGEQARSLNKLDLTKLMSDNSEDKFTDEKASQNRDFSFD